MNQYQFLTCFILQVTVIQSQNGAKSSESVPQKWTAGPRKTLSESDTAVISVEIEREEGESGVTLRLGETKVTVYPNQQLFHPNFVVLNRHENGSTISVPELTCDYTTPSNQPIHVAVDICDGLHGIIYTGGDLYHIQPLPKTQWKNYPHDIPHIIQIIRKNDENLRQMIGYTAARKWRRTKRDAGEKRDPQLTDGQTVKIETAVFVDRDLLHYFQSVFPADTERHLLRFVLAMFNAVQILYHHPSLGVRVDFVLKRLEILHSEPTGLQRPNDIDRYLSSFCDWQQRQQPQGHDPLKWDHALMLTGLDLYAIGKSGRISSQVVGLAPVAGMCQPRSSCTVNEGRHFESVFVVAHEIGHNLGMRHDGPTADNQCDPSENIMAPTLARGRFTWSACSRHYLSLFLKRLQAKCLFESSGPELDHLEGGILPGERFDSNTQCTLKHGAGSIHTSQGEADLCRDLRCTKERFTWAAHPALEGTTCNSNMWCRGGLCVPRGSALEEGGVRDGGWSGWGPLSECASACLDDPARQIPSTGIAMAYRRCNNPRPQNNGKQCAGSDKRYHMCRADQCANLAPTTIDDFAEAICRRAKDVETDLTGTGRQRRTSNSEEACTVWCDTHNGGGKSKRWIFPDGTACGEIKASDSLMFCIAGKCVEFQCFRNGTFIASAEKCSSLSPRINTKWIPFGPCHSNCIQPGQGLRILKKGSQLNIQLCQLEKACGRRRTVYEFANKVCSKFSEKINKLSGLGLQLAPSSAEEPDRSCQIACQDSEVQNRFYLVTGEDGWFPFGTDCSAGQRNLNAYCVSGKCLQFGHDGLPLQESRFEFPNIKRKRSLEATNRTVIARLDKVAVTKVIDALHVGKISSWEPSPATICLDWDNPVHANFPDSLTHTD